MIERRNERQEQFDAFHIVARLWRLKRGGIQTQKDTYGYACERLSSRI